jgi:hypothetical protein
MTVDESALVLVLPDDTVDALIARVLASHKPTVELLVPDGATALHDTNACQSLHDAAASQNITLLLIASDELTLAAARSTPMQIVGVKDTRVALPTTLPAPNGDEAPGVGAAAMPAAQEHAQADRAFLDAHDQDFMDDLDSLSDIMSGSTPAAAATAPTDGAATTEDDDFAAALDDLSSSLGGEEEPRSRAAAPSAARPRIRPEDIELNDAEKQQATATGAAFEADAVSRPSRPRIRPEDIELSDDEKQRAAAVGGTGRSSTTRNRLQPGSRASHEEQPSPMPPRKLSRPLLIAAAVLIIVLLLLLVLMGFRNSGGVSFAAISGTVSPAVVVVNPPASPTEEVVIEDQPIFIARVNEEASSTAVRAEPISAMAVYTVTGEVVGETLAPAELASGVINLVNESQQALSLPQGTEVVGVNAQGQEVRFTTDTPVTIPSATSERTGPGIVISFGVAQVGITARTPGSDSNVAANTLSRIIIPGQGEIGVSIEHAAITNGTDQVIRVVKDTDVQRLLGDALTGLNSQGRDVLAAHANNNGLVLEMRNITPSTGDLQAGEGYDITVIPPVGTTIDPANPNFSVSVRSNFSALATPPGQSLEDQLKVALPKQLDSEGRLPFGMKVNITGWHWSSSQLTVDAILQPTGEVKQLDAQTRAAIRDAIKGKSAAQAREALEQFKAQGHISGYTLPPERDTIPGLDFLLELQVGEPMQQNIES